VYVTVIPTEKKHCYGSAFLFKVEHRRRLKSPQEAAKGKLPRSTVRLAVARNERVRDFPIFRKEKHRARCFSYM
jgi:hypothetical protein